MRNSILSYLSKFRLSESNVDEQDLSIKNNQLAFVGCSPRSGSTLLTRILDSHSKISAPCEIGIPKYFSGDKKQESIEKKYKKICNYYSTGFQESKNSPKRLMRAIAIKEEKDFIVIKEPRQSLFLKDIESDFSGAKYIHLVRDVRSIAMSSMFSSSPENGFWIWYEYNMAILKLTSELPQERTFTICYEDIVSRPNKCISDLTEFLGYEFEPAMLNYSDFRHADEAMKLWDGASPNTSKLHSSLRTKGISPDIMASRKSYSDDVCELYRRLDKIRRLNQEFGYLD